MLGLRRSCCQSPGGIPCGNCGNIPTTLTVTVGGPGAANFTAFYSTPTTFTVTYQSTMDWPNSMQSACYGGGPGLGAVRYLFTCLLGGGIQFTMRMHGTSCDNAGAAYDCVMQGSVQSCSPFQAAASTPMPQLSSPTCSGSDFFACTFTFTP